MLFMLRMFLIRSFCRNSFNIWRPEITSNPFPLSSLYANSYNYIVRSIVVRRKISFKLIQYNKEITLFINTIISFILLICRIILSLVIAFFFGSQIGQSLREVTVIYSYFGLLNISHIYEYIIICFIYYFIKFSNFVRVLCCTKRSEWARRDDDGSIALQRAQIPYVQCLLSIICINTNCTKPKYNYFSSDL